MNQHPTIPGLDAEGAPLTLAQTALVQAAPGSDTAHTLATRAQESAEAALARIEQVEADLARKWAFLRTSGVI